MRAASDRLNKWGQVHFLYVPFVRETAASVPFVAFVVVAAEALSIFGRT